MFMNKRCNLIAIPFTKGGVWNFWSFIKDEGQDLEYGWMRVPAWRLTDTTKLGEILKEEKKRLTCDNFKRATCAVKEVGSIKQYRQSMRIAMKHRTVLGF